MICQRGTADPLREGAVSAVQRGHCPPREQSPPAPVASGPREHASPGLPWTDSRQRHEVGPRSTTLARGRRVECTRQAMVTRRTVGGVSVVHDGGVRRTSGKDTTRRQPRAERICDETAWRFSACCSGAPPGHVGRGVSNRLRGGDSPGRRYSGPTPFREPSAIQADRTFGPFERLRGGHLGPVSSGGQDHGVGAGRLEAAASRRSHSSVHAISLDLL